MTIKENSSVRDGFKALRRKRVVKTLRRKLCRFSPNEQRDLGAHPNRGGFIATKENSPVRDGIKSPLPLTTIKTLYSYRRNEKPSLLSRDKTSSQWPVFLEPM